MFCKQRHHQLLFSLSQAYEDFFQAKEDNSVLAFLGLGSQSSGKSECQDTWVKETELSSHHTVDQLLQN